MTRQGRTLLVIGIASLAGVAALALIARQYQRMGMPTRSVAELEPRTPAFPAPFPDPRQEASGGTAESGPPSVASRPPAGEGEEGGALALVDGFIKVRRAVKEVLDQDPDAARTMIEDEEGKVQWRRSSEEPVRQTMGRWTAYQGVLLDLRSSKGRALRDAGMDREEYKRILEAYRSWIGGEEGGDPVLEAAFETRRAELAEVDLGDYEVLDF